MTLKIVRCKKHKLNVTGCSHWMGNLPTQECEICISKRVICEPYGNSKGREKTIRRNVYRPVKNKGNVVKHVPILKVRPFFKGGSTHGEDI